ncbi:MAG TPA: 50S ribosomal protein L17 [Elusimicrobiota bacterium]|jgi:large subunit ribosomal protein L17|nr:50S ribosomal protein L17 [Elusimicrobiota bacterium]HMU95188.1 50S ribosomal protein L17 [Elusimicrobiota bacterium]HMX42501.1 50S ribosomal protein L17 [Elusimicrobiota bacterium]HMX95351.1 50S ribosomal protein L17 [Elusimicrobiota bacterium]HMZ25970.1 50S ribosomal protein L17 [Elusimicrobiota bacterium]
MKTHAGRKLSRPTGARVALLRGLATSLLQHEEIRTTHAKAKEAARFAEGLLALAKQKTLPARREIAAAINDKDVRKKIYDVLVPRYQSRSGGCTRVYRLGNRSGDNAEMAILKLVQ